MEAVAEKPAKKVQEYYLFVDYISYRGGMWNCQRARIMPVGGVPGYIKCCTSLVDNAEKAARRWAKRNNVKLVGE